MNEEIRNKMAELILGLTEKLDTYEPGTKEHNATKETLEVLYKLSQQDLKNDADYDEKLYRREIEEKREETRKEESKRDWVTNIVLTAAAIGAPLAVQVMLTAWGFKFEVDHVFSSSTFRTFFGKFNVFKKK